MFVKKYAWLSSWHSSSDQERPVMHANWSRHLPQQYWWFSRNHCWEEPRRLFWASLLSSTCSMIASCSPGSWELGPEILRAWGLETRELQVHVSHPWLRCSRARLESLRAWELGLGCERMWAGTCITAPVAQSKGTLHRQAYLLSILQVIHGLKDIISESELERHGTNQPLFKVK